MGDPRVDRVRGRGHPRRVRAARGRRSGARAPRSGGSCRIHSGSGGLISMRIIVIGGTGLIGSTIVKNLQAQDHDAVAASPASGVNTLTGEGLAEVLEGAKVVV